MKSFKRLPFEVKCLVLSIARWTMPSWGTLYNKAGQRVLNSQHRHPLQLTTMNKILKKGK